MEPRGRGCGREGRVVPGLLRCPLPPRLGHPRHCRFPAACSLRVRLPRAFAWPWSARLGYSRAGDLGPGPGGGHSRMKGWERAGRKGALIVAPRCRLRKSGRGTPMGGQCGRRGAWERPACASVKSRARRRRGPGRILPRPPALAEPREAQTLPCQAPGAAARSPVLQPRPVERGAAAGTGTRTALSRVIFSTAICLCGRGCPFTFRSRRAGDPARREGVGDAGHREGWRPERGSQTRAGTDPAGKWTLDPPRKRARLKRPG